jgi:hypothetical protein
MKIICKFWEDNEVDNFSNVHVLSFCGEKNISILQTNNQEIEGKSNTVATIQLSCEKCSHKSFMRKPIMRRKNHSNHLIQLELKSKKPKSQLPALKQNCNYD